MTRSNSWASSLLVSSLRSPRSSKLAKSSITRNTVWQIITPRARISIISRTSNSNTQVTKQLTKLWQPAQALELKIRESMDIRDNRRPSKGLWLTKLRIPKVASLTTSKNGTGRTLTTCNIVLIWNLNLERTTSVPCMAQEMENLTPQQSGLEWSII